MKKLKKEYSEAAANGLNKAVKILAEHDDASKKIIKVKKGVDNLSIFITALRTELISTSVSAAHSYICRIRRLELQE